MEVQLALHELLGIFAKYLIAPALHAGNVRAAEGNLLQSLTAADKIWRHFFIRSMAIKLDENRLKARHLEIVYSRNPVWVAVFCCV